MQTNRLFAILLITLGVTFICLPVFLWVGLPLPLLFLLAVGVFIAGIGASVVLFYLKPETDTPAANTENEWTPGAAAAATPSDVSAPTVTRTKAATAQASGREERPRPGKPNGVSLLLALIALLLLCNLLVLARPLFTVRETHIIDCRDIDTLAENGWRVVSSYSYQLGDANEGYTVYNECVMERERLGWPGKERASDEDASVDDFDFAPESTTYQTPITTPALNLVRATAPSTAWVEPTQMPLPTPTPWPTDTPYPTRTPLPSPTSRPTGTPLPTWTPLPSPTPMVTDTPLIPTPTPTSLPLPTPQTLGPISNPDYNEEFSVELEVTHIQLVEATDTDSQPEPGFVYIVAHLAAKNLGPDTILSFGPSNFQVKDAEGVFWDDAYVAAISDCALETVDLAPDGQISGCLSFEVPDTWPLELIYAPYREEDLEEGQYLSLTLRSGE